MPPYQSVGLSGGDVTAIALTKAGSDSGGGAGIQADLKTFSALGVYGASVLTTITAQNTVAVTAIEAMPSSLVRAQIETVFEDLAVAAVKIGMLGQPELIRTVAESLRDCDLPIVLDPVMVAKSGDRLLEAEAIAALQSELLPIASILTPNLPEAAEILDSSIAGDPTEMEAQGRALLVLGPKWVLMKGGHAAGPICTDILIGPKLHSLTAMRNPTSNTHGTGCTLSAAIAAGLAQGLDVPDAVIGAHSYLQSAIAAADQLEIGSGHGPVHHFYAQWK
ncbi:bifunctional hydroxymethylpyrimidine kinase/phosphomethylpyrimidine kinase [Aquamicrobium segne]|uniref:hydroxymethylpyrimidine kinase n=1 Tax=Aquamicrobium segne TaxID=469547 RepID=A0ABW0H0B3_9HYPH